MAITLFLRLFVLEGFDGGQCGTPQSWQALHVESDAPSIFLSLRTQYVLYNLWIATFSLEVWYNITLNNTIAFFRRFLISTLPFPLLVYVTTSV